VISYRYKEEQNKVLPKLKMEQPTGYLKKKDPAFKSIPLKGQKKEEKCSR